MKELLEEAIMDMHVCEERFNVATGDYVDPAALELQAAKLRYNALLREVKNESIQDNG